MKKIVLMMSFILLMGSLLMYAQFASASDDDVEKIADLLLIPTQGQVLSGLSYDSLNLSAKYTLANTDFLNSSQKESRLNYSFLYGFSDKHSLGFDLKYTLSKEVRYDYASSLFTDYSANSKGFYDPAVKVKGRFFGKSNSNTKGNYKLSLSPKIIDAKQATKDNDGTMGNGGTDISAGIDFGTSLKSYQIAILVDYTMKGGSLKQYADGSFEDNYSGGNILNAQIAGQLILSPGITGGLFYTYNDVDSTTAESKALKSGYSNFTRKYGKYTTQSYGFGGSFELNQNNLVSLIYEIVSVNTVNYDLTIGSSTLSGNIKDINRTAVYIRWLGRF